MELHPDLFVFCDSYYNLFYMYEPAKALSAMLVTVLAIQTSVILPQYLKSFPIYA